MSSLIHFRSKIEWHHLSEGGTRQNRGQSSELRWIRTYSIGDDPRDIAWHRWAWLDTLYTKERDNTLHPSVVLLSLLDDETLSFSTEDHPDAKQSFLTELQSRIAESARKIRFPYICTDTIQSRVSWEWEKSIIIVLGDIESIDSIGELSVLSKKNDIIFLFLLHPTEIQPEKNMLFASKTAGRKYHEKLREYREKAEREAIEHDIAFLPCTTEDDPTLLLNYFFKYRYV